MDSLRERIERKVLAIRRHARLGPRNYFCLNSGRCGSQYLIKLLKANGVSNCYHEPEPTLLRQGVAYYLNNESEKNIVSTIRRTRSGIFLEASNRLFSLTRPIRLAFPDARFLFLFRDGRDVVRSGLERDWYGPTDPSKGIRIFSDSKEEQFVKICKYWTEVNRRIIDDLEKYECHYIKLPFESLVAGESVPQLGEFIGRGLKIDRLPKANATEKFATPRFEDWRPAMQRQFVEICGEMMERLGYGESTSHPKAVQAGIVANR